MDVVEIVGQIVFEGIIPWLIMMPGAFIRWIISKFNGKKTSFREHYRKTEFLTGFCGVVFWTFLIFCLIYF